MKNQTQPSTVKMPQSLALNISLSPLRLRLAVLSGICLLVWIIRLLLPDPLTTLEERVGALAWVTSTEVRSQPEQRLVIVAIDEASLQEIGPWPWPRETLAALSERLQAYGVSSQIFDLVFPEAKPGDTLLNRTLKQNNVIIGQIPILDAQSTQRTGVLSGGLPQACFPTAPKAHGYLANNPSVLSADTAVGHITPHISADGSVRFQAPVICHQGQAYPSLALSVLLRNLSPGEGGLSLQTPETSQAGEQGELSFLSRLMQPAGRLALDDYPLLSVPINEQGLMRVSYQRHPQDFIYLSAADILAGRVDPRQLNNRWALVGATAFGMGDLVPSPYSGLTPGVEIQARLITSMLDRSVPYTPSGIWLYQAGLLGSVFLWLLILAARAGHHRHRISRGVFMMTPLLIPVFAYSMHSVALQYQLWLGWSSALLYGSSGALALIILEYWRNRHEKQRLFENLNSFLPEDIAARIAFHQPSGQLQAERMTCIVLSADLRNFSAFQRHSSPESTVQLLHGFYTLASQVISQHQGALFELKADALIAIWPVVEDAEHPDNGTEAQARHAWAAAAGIQQKIQPMLRHALTEQSEPLGLGIGLACGQVIQGQLGAQRNRTPVILGDAVSRALGLQRMTQDLAYPTLCSTDISQHLPADSIQSIGRFLIPGGTRPQTLFAPESFALSQQVPPLDDADTAGITRLADYRTDRR